MDATQIVQAVMSVLQPDGSSNDTSTFTTAGTQPKSLPQMIFMLFSLAAVRDWVKLIFIGSLLEASRRFLLVMWERIVDAVWVTATFEFDETAAGTVSFASKP